MTSEPRPPMLMPLPRQMGQTTERFEVGSDLRYSLSGDGGGPVAAAMRRFAEWLRDRVQLDIVTEPITDEAAELRIVCAEQDGAYPQLREDESYALQVGASGIDLVATRSVGVIRGLATLQQLILSGLDDEADERRAILGGTVIDDRPRFPWRGLMIDVSRHFIPVPVLERQLDAMAFVKLNVLHLHLTDDQGFRVESQAFPNLHGKGSGGEFYSQAEVSDLVGYAASRGIRIVPEFDLPGHASSWLAGYPHLGCRPDEAYRVVETWGCVDVCFNPANEQVYEFLDAFFADVLPLFPDEFVHIGGDEVHGDEWRSTPEVVAFMRDLGIADTIGLQAHFNARLHAILGRHGKRMIGWDEIAHPAIPTDVVVQSWRGPESVAGVTAQGYDCVRSHGYYLNALYSAADHYLVHPDDDGLPAEHAARVLGGEACMWTEFVDEHNLDSRLWPRTAAIAERFWSPRDNRDAYELRERLGHLSALLWFLGMRHDQDFRDHIAQLAGDRPTEALAVILGTLVPEPLDAVIPSRETDRHTVLRRLRDVIPVVNLEFGCSFGATIDDYRVDERSRRALELVVRGWEESCDAFEREFDGTPILGDLAPFAARLRILGEIVATGMVALRGGRRLSPESKATTEKLLDELRAPHAGMRLDVIDAILTLVHAVGPVDG